VKFLVDEDLSPRLVRDLHNMGYEATSVRDRGRLGLLDHHVLEWAIAEDRIIVTANAADYRELVGNAGMHPGLWILPNVALDPASKFLRDAATLVEARMRSPRRTCSTALSPCRTTAPSSQKNSPSLLEARALPIAQRVSVRRPDPRRCATSRR
jgi:predicted nuclease of predicted toxin-antitoxin system